MDGLSFVASTGALAGVARRRGRRGGGVAPAVGGLAGGAAPTGDGTRSSALPGKTPMTPRDRGVRGRDTLALPYERGLKKWKRFGCRSTFTD